jgi:acyl carrier protein phosphodiesterase
MSSQLLHESHGKYAPVLVDVYYDFFLSRHWSRFHPESMVDFSRKIYRQLLSHLDIMPERTQRQLQAMVQDDWLLNYATYEGMEFTFRQMSRRVSRPQQLVGAVDSLKRFEPQLEADFLAFFPEIIAYVQGECAC